LRPACPGTGGESGIGLSTVRLLAALGAAVAALDLEPGSVCEPVEHTPTPLAVRADVTDDSSVQAAIEEVASRFGGLDILVNNAGVGAQGTVETNLDDEWHRVFDVNVIGIVRITRAALPHLRRSERAAIVNTCSIVATVGLPRPGVVCGHQGGGLRPDPGNGRRPPRRRHPGQLR
jgi:2-keto-3-deoxy-L-fuconate dehydrogenase